MEMTMATTCFRPSQLPPSGGGSLTASGGGTRKSSLKNNTTVTVAIVEPQPGSRISKTTVEPQTGNRISNANLATKPPARIRKKSAGAQLSSTYRSFRDPVEEDEIQVLASEDMEVKPIVTKSRTKAPKLTLVRSHSEGDLSIAPQNLPLAPTSTLSKCLRVLSGSWKNLFQLGGMSRPPKPAAQVKKVAPPAVPDTGGNIGGGGFRHSGSSFGSAGYGSAGEDHPVVTSFHEPPHISRDGYDVNEMYAMSGKSPGGQFNYPAFTFPGPQYTQVVHGNTKSAVYYHHQLSLQEDQGIDMTQSPGRDSPGSSGSGSRHSTASLDSGRASGCHLGPPHPHTSTHPPRCSLSSSSVGSSEHGAPSRVERLLMQGVPDQDVLHSWLMDLHFEEYFPLFMAAGYDMHTISRMTPEDLTAIGIKKPNHRKKLKAEIGQLNISDGLPDYIPGSMTEWLRLLRLEEYGTALECQGYNTIEDVTQLTWEDLEDIGIVKLGHQKRIILAIKRVKDLRAGKFPPQHIPTFIPHQIRGGRGKSLESLEEGMNNGGGCGGGNTVAGGTSSFVPPPMPPPAGWRPRSYDDGDITPTNEQLPLHEGGGTLPRPRGLVRPRPIAKIPATFCPAYRPEELICGGGTGTLKRLPPSPPKRSLSESSGGGGCMTVVADLHCIDQPPPPPAPTAPWAATESQLIASLKAQGSDSSFKSSSSTESDSLPFANENAGTIKQRVARTGADYIPPATRVQQTSDQPLEPSSANTRTIVRKPGQEPADVLNDIGNMLANLTDELDAMLEEEKRQGLTDD
ncbi:caskin-2 isoform X2 [Nilaparvata lugens]|uniref:caskin-2 isoform X2 n=1 Tax=Nilaparvata lugens TaxID=108931 RepID=UPI00193DDCB8|nr:caskin-2 isoform X2 [Nilaparvata lugens]